MALFNQIFSAIMTAIIAIQSALSLPVLSLNFKFNVDASVFESGDDMYTVIWSTTRPGSGYITYTFDGKDYTVTDQVGGNIRSLDTIHAVRVPKAHLDNNEYTYHSQYVGSKLGYSAVKGKVIDSEPVEFKGYHGESEINILELSDIHGNPGPAEKAAAGFEAEPSLVVLNGDIVSQVVTKTDFLNILEYSNMFSKGEIPVAYVRGNHEPRGEYASEMLQYFRTSTGGLYYTFNYGPMWSVVLDGGEDKEDSNPEYSGLVDFRQYIADETKWLAGLEPSDAQYKLCLVHKPELDDLDGNKWLGMLSELNISAVLSGHWHQLNLHYQDGSAPYQRMITGGKNGSNGFIATMVTLADNEIRVVSYNEKAELVNSETFPLAQL